MTFAVIVVYLVGVISTQVFVGLKLDRTRDATFTAWLWPMFWVIYLGDLERRYWNDRR